MTETNRRLVPYFAILFIFISWGSVFLTHKIAGPLTRLGQCFQELKSGNLRLRLRFRKYDEATGLAPKFNTMVSSLDESIVRMKEIASKLPKNQESEQLKKELERFKTTA